MDPLEENTKMMDYIRIFLVDDHQLFLESLAGLIQKHPSLKIVGMAKDAKSAVKEIRTLQPDIVLMDISIPNLDGIEATRLITKTNPKIAILILSMHDEIHFLCRALEAGAIGYLLEDSPAEELFLAIEMADHGISFISPAILRKLVMNHPGTKKRQRSRLLPTLT